MTTRSKKSTRQESEGEDPPPITPAYEYESDQASQRIVYYWKDDDNDDDKDESEEEDDEFEDQGSSDEDVNLEEKQMKPDEDDSENELNLDDNLEAAYEEVPRKFADSKNQNPMAKRKAGSGTEVEEKYLAEWMNLDNLSSDDEDEEGTGNRIGSVPLHWYEDYDHTGYNSHGNKVMKPASAEKEDLLDQAIAQNDTMESGTFVVHDALNDKNVTLTARQLELIRRVQGGAFAHPEFDGNSDYIDYYSSIPELSGLNSNRTEPKGRFQPRPWEKLQVDRLLTRLKKGDINMDYLTGMVHDMNEVRKKNDLGGYRPYLMWKGDEENCLNTRKGPQHIAPPRTAPPGHAESYRPPDEYLPTEEDLLKWEDMELKDRPYGRLVPKQFPSLRSVGAYEHAVSDTFERCLDLYLCPRVMKRRLNIDPESLVPKLPNASDLRPFPTAKCIEYKTKHDGDEAPFIRCVSPSPDGQYVASGASDGMVRIWEVQTGRMLRSWNVGKLVQEIGFATEIDNEPIVKPIVSTQWNPNRNHHCLAAAVGSCVVIVATGTAGEEDAEITASLLLAARSGGNVTNERAAKAVQWKAIVVVENVETSISAFSTIAGPIVALKTNREVANLRWHAKGDYFVTVSPRAASASVLIHQLSKGNSQQPFTKTKGETQLACFHPNKPFLFVANQNHVRVYHLVKQTMVKRLVSGCKWISSLDVHPSGDHLIAGTLDRRLLWFDLDLSSTPFTTLRYHERGLRSVQYHSRYPLMASSSDDESVHVFHSMVYSDLIKNPLIVPVKILRGHSVTKRLGVLAIAFHPNQPWLFSGGADGRMFLYQDI